VLSWQNSMSPVQVWAKAAAEGGDDDDDGDGG
jgi:hypothetical protein